MIGGPDCHTLWGELEELQRRVRNLEDNLDGLREELEEERVL